MHLSKLGNAYNLGPTPWVAAACINQGAVKHNTLRPMVHNMHTCGGMPDIRQDLVIGIFKIYKAQKALLDKNRRYLITTVSNLGNNAFV